MVEPDAARSKPVSKMLKLLRSGPLGKDLEVLGVLRLHALAEPTGPRPGCGHVHDALRVPCDAVDNSASAHRAVLRPHAQSLLRPRAFPLKQRHKETFMAPTTSDSSKPNEGQSHFAPRHDVYDANRHSSNNARRSSPGTAIFARKRSSKMVDVNTTNGVETRPQQRLRRSMNHHL